MNERFFYQKVKCEVELGRLKFIAILAPARSGSTLLMRILDQSLSVHGFINQPFHLTYSFPYMPPENREEAAYERIWEKYQQTRALHDQRTTIVLVLKCMARNLGIGHQAFRFVQLIDKVILLIRNPFLTIDSLLKEQVISIEDMPEASHHNFNDYAFQKGFIDRTGYGNHWQALRDFVLKTRKYQMIADLLIETLASIELNQYEMDMLNDYKCHFRHEFDNPRHFFALSWTGWHNIKIIYEAYISKILNYIVVDSTILRCMPEKICREISDALDITYSPHMISNWRVDEEKVIDDAVIKALWMQRCYSKVTGSSSIKPPNEYPIPIHFFPHIYQSHILNMAQPIYLSLLKDGNAVRPRSSEKIHELLSTTVDGDGKTLRQIDCILAEMLIMSVS